MADVIEVERSSDNTARSFSPDQMSDGTLYDWVTAQQPDADGLVDKIQDLSGNSRDLVPISNDPRPHVVKDGYMQTENGRPTLQFHGGGAYFQTSVPSSGGRTIAFRARPQYGDRQLLAEVDGLRVLAESGSIVAELQNGNGTSVSQPYTTDPEPLSTRIVAACDGNTLALNVEGSESTTTYSTARTQSGTFAVGYTSGEQGLFGTIQQVYTWEENKGGAERSEILARLDQPSGFTPNPTEPDIPAPWSFEKDRLVRGHVLDQSYWKDLGITNDLGDGKPPAFSIRASRTTVI
jgi:hypothetical protein